MNNEEIKELKEKVIVLQNFHKVKDKKLKLMEDRIERQNKLIAVHQDRVEIANNYIDQVIMYKIPKELYNDIEKLQDIINGNNFSGSDKE